MKLSNFYHFPHPYSTSTPLQVVRWTGNREFKTASATSQRITLPAGTKLVELSVEKDVYINFGDNTVVAAGSIDSKSSTDNGNRLFLAGVQVVPVPVDDNGDAWTHVAVIEKAGGGIVQVERVD